MGTPPPTVLNSFYGNLKIIDATVVKKKTKNINKTKRESLVYLYVVLQSKLADT